MCKILPCGFCIKVWVILNGLILGVICKKNLYYFSFWRLFIYYATSNFFIRTIYPIFMICVITFSYFLYDNVLNMCFIKILYRFISFYIDGNAYC